MSRTIAVGLMLLGSVQVTATIDTIIPWPKQVSPVGEAIALEGFRIIADSSERARIGADEINQRITSLGGEALPVLNVGAELPEGKLIIIAPCDSSAGVMREFGGRSDAGGPRPAGGM